MQSITVTPIELLQVGGWTALCLGVTMLFYWWLKFLKTESPVPKIADWTALVLVFVGGISFPVRYTIEGRIAHKAAFAELPVEWQDFCEGLDELISNLHFTAISEFVNTKPPKLTLDHYAAITKTKLWGHKVREATRNLRYSTELKTMVDFSFARKRMEGN